MKRRKRHRPIGSNRPQAPSVVAITIFSLISMAVFAGCLYASYQTGGNTVNWMGGLGVIFIMVGLICLIVGVRVFKNTDYTVVSRIIGLVMPLAATGLWLCLYIVGMLYG